MVGSIGSGGYLHQDTVEHCEPSALAAGVQLTGAIMVGGFHSARVRAIFSGASGSIISGIFASPDDTVPGNFVRCTDIADSVAATDESDVYVHSIDIYNLRSPFIRVECNTQTGGSAIVLVTKYASRVVPKDAFNVNNDGTNYSDAGTACSC